MVHGALIPADESLPITKQVFNGLNDYQAAVGGWIEAIDLDALDASFFANEESKLNGNELNRRATMMWWLASPHIRHRDAIRGDVCLVGLPDEEGDTKSAPDDLVNLLFETKSFKAEFQTADDPEAFNGNQVVFTDYFEAVNYALIKFDNWAAVVRCRVVSA